MRIHGAKRLALLGGVAALTVGAIGAYAYWSTTGTGSGKAFDGTSSPVTITGTALTALYPATTTSVTFTAANPGASKQSIQTIHLVSVAAYVSDAARTTGTTPIVGCGGANLVTNDFSMPDLAVAPATDGQIAAGATAQAITAAGVLTMNNLTTNQDLCKGAFLELTFTTS